MCCYCVIVILTLVIAGDMWQQVLCNGRLNWEGTDIDLLKDAPADMKTLVLCP